LPFKWKEVSFEQKYLSRQNLKKYPRMKKGGDSVFKPNEHKPDPMKETSTRETLSRTHGRGIPSLRESRGRCERKNDLFEKKKGASHDMLQ